jgi:catechol 2,3-dioxygenase-like lactoylglutathione lyase family enzyme
MITGFHAIIYTHDADADRAFFRDVLGFPHVDSGGGWLLFRLPPAELGFHPTDAGEEHEVYLMCDDIEATVADLEAKGAKFAAPVQDAGFGLLVRLKLPGGSLLGMYQPKHHTAIESKLTR